MQIIIGNSIGVNRTSTLGGGPFEYTAIDNNFSMEFDGVSDYVDIGNGISFNYNDPFTISTWVNVDAVSGTKAIYNKYDSSISGGRGIALNLFSSSGSGLNLIYFDLYSTNSGSTSTRKRITTRSTDFIISPDIWYLLTITYDGSGLGSGIKMYLNGVSKSVTITQDNLQSGDITNSLNAYVGATTTPSSFFNGTMDEYAIWSLTLSEGTIEAIYNTTNDNPGKAADLTETPEGAPTAWYRMGD